MKMYYFQNVHTYTLTANTVTQWQLCLSSYLWTCKQDD